MDKVKLPKEVAEAIELCRNSGLSGISIITSMEHVSQLFRDYDKEVLNALTVIKEFAWKVVGGGQDLLAALVNGYEVERTPEEKVIDIYHDYKPGGSEVIAIQRVLIALGIKIEGVNT